MVKQLVAPHPTHWWITGNRRGSRRDRI